MKILICEDNTIIAMDLEMVIEDLGHEVAGHVTRSDRCLMQCDREPPDLVLVDIDLADGPTGLDLTRRLADMDIPSVIVSGQTAALQPGDHAAMSVLSKPVAVAELETVIRASCEVRYRGGR